MAKKAKFDKKTSASSEIKRKFKQSPVLYIGSVAILILVIIAFLGGDLITPAVKTWDGIFGYYDNVPIKWVRDNTFGQSTSSAMSHYQSQGIDMSNELNIKQVWQQAYEVAIVHNAILQVMKRSNYVVPERIVDKKVSQHPDLQENGRYSSVLYNRMSKSEQLNLWRQTHDDIIKSVYFSDFFDGLLMTNAEAEFVGNMASPERSFDMVSFNIDAYPESEYLAYAQANARLFDSIHLSKITISAGEREAKKVLDLINSGTITFEEAARTQSQDSLADKGGDMGTRYICDLEEEITSSEGQDFVFNLRRGELSPVLKLMDISTFPSREVWVIYRLEDNIKKADFEDEQVMDRVRLYLRSKNRGRMEDWASEQAKEFAAIAKGTSFEAAARAQDLQIRSFGPFPINYSGVELFSGVQTSPIPGFSERDITNLSRNENFWKIAFSTRLKTPSEPFVQGNNVIVLYPVEEINVEETTAANTASAYLSYWMYMITEQSMQHYFKSNPRMDDRFDNAFKEMMR